MKANAKKSFRQLHRLKQKAKKINKQPRIGDIKPGDADLIHAHTLRRKRGTNPRAPVSLSGKKRNRALKRLRHHQKDVFEKKKLQEAIEMEIEEKRRKKKEKKERSLARRATRLQEEAIATSTGDIEMKPADDSVVSDVQ